MKSWKPAFFAKTEPSLTLVTMIILISFRKFHVLLFPPLKFKRILWVKTGKTCFKVYKMN